MKQAIFDVEGLTEEQIELARRFVALMRESKVREEARSNLKGLLWKGVGGKGSLTEEEVEKLAAEAVAFARKKA
ncbi:MAG: hypothetical protein AB1641_12785 [Thermodesulfobacteriota bacterium]